MTIASSHVFEKEHIESHRFNAPAELAEQAVYCLELVAQLVEVGLSFQFKGGNSLLLILDEPRRFSIDVDIATDEPRERIEACLEKISGEGKPFLRWDRRQHKTKPWLPIASYHLFYSSVYVASGTNNVMLDVQLRRSPYRTEFKPVTCGKLYDVNTKVELPLPSSIIGDKLLTLGPRTLGIPFGKGKDAQRLKHVHDVSVLAATQPALEAMRESFAACLEHENDLQETKSQMDEVMLDTVRYCASVLRHATLPEVHERMPEDLKENISGLPLFAQHLFAKEYAWKQLQQDTARVAVCVVAACRDSVDKESFLRALQGEPVGETERGVAEKYACEPVVARQWAWVEKWIGELPANDK